MATNSGTLAVMNSIINHLITITLILGICSFSLTFNIVHGQFDFHYCTADLHRYPAAAVVVDDELVFCQLIVVSRWLLEFL